jgi:hypothetical protein
MKPLPPEKQHLQALFDAYVEASGLRITLSPARERTLREFDRRTITPADVRWVVSALKGRVDRGIPGYTIASLEWGNAMADVDRFEDRLATLRITRERRLAREQAAARADAGTSSGSTLIAPAADVHADAIRDRVKQLAADWRRQLLASHPPSAPPDGERVDGGTA